MSISTGIFFDGYSSAAHEVSLLWHEATGVLSFEGPTIEPQSVNLREARVDRESHSTRIQFGPAFFQILKTSDPALIAEIDTFQRVNGMNGWYHRMVRWGFTMHILMAAAILGLLGLAYLYVLPSVAEKAVVLLPEAYDTEMGDSFYREFVRFNEIDSAKTRNLNSFAEKIQLQNHKSLNFAVVQSTTVNAFALPNGQIVVYTGLLDKMADYRELVALLGHEASHVNKRHSVKMLCRNAAGYIFISMILSDVNGILAILGDNIHSLQSLSYSRKFEEEADQGGLEIMADNKQDPKGMADLFSKLNEHSKIAIPAFLSTHPMNDERIKQVQEFLTKNSGPYENNRELSAIFAELKK